MTHTSAADDALDLQPTANPDEVTEADADNTQDDVDAAVTRNEYHAAPSDDVDAADEADI